MALFRCHSQTCVSLQILGTAKMASEYRVAKYVENIERSFYYRGTTLFTFLVKTIAHVSVELVHTQ